jgi:hypothetical protein
MFAVFKLLSNGIQRGSICGKTTRVEVCRLSW